MDKEEGIPGSGNPEGSRDNGEMITSFLLLMCTDIFRHILQVQTILTLIDLKDL